MRPLARLFQAIAISTVCTTGWSVLQRVEESDMGRLREVGLTWFVRRLGLAFDWDIALLSPPLFGQQYLLSGWSDACAFLLAALLVNLALAFVLGALLVPLVWLLGRRLPPSDVRTERFWGLVFPLAILIGFAIPEATRELGFDPARALEFDSRGLLRSLAVTLASAALTLFALFWILRPRWLDTLLGLASICCTIIVTGLLLASVSMRLLATSEATITAAPGAPNVLLVSIDSLRADHVHSYGYARQTTPRIDALAAQGVRFETVVAPSSWTLPSHMTLLTALDPRDHGVTDEGDKLDLDAVLLAEVFLDAGYTTAGFVSGPFLDATYGYLQGFDHYDDYSALPSNWRLALTEETSTGLFRVIREWLLEWDLEGRRRPFFAFLHMWDVHFEYLPPEPHDIFDSDYSGSVALRSFESDEINEDMAPADLHRFVSLYDGEIRHTDAHLGKVLDVLKDLDVFDETIIVITADHGEEFFEHGNKGHDRTLYDESLRVPLVIRYPSAAPAGAVVPDLVRLQDVAPTILSLAGVQKPAEFGLSATGSARAERDLSALIRGSSPRAEGPSVALGDHRAGELGSIRTDRHKLIVSEDGAMELYDLVRDPGEEEDLAGSRPARSEDLLEQYRARTSGQDGPALSRHKDLSAEQIEGLRSLGYVE